MRLFFSYNEKQDGGFVAKVAEILDKREEVFFFERAGCEGDAWLERVGQELRLSEVIVLFVGNEIGTTQRQEAKHAAAKEHNSRLIRLRVDLPGMTESDAAWQFPSDGIDPIRVSSVDETGARRCANAILRAIRRGNYQIPAGYPADYEKTIIDTYRDDKALVEKDFPEEWPSVPRADASTKNPVPDSELGQYKNVKEAVLVDARLRSSSATGTGVQPLTFLEAGPREHLRYPLPDKQTLTVAVLVSGGIAPGINAVLSGIATRHLKYREHVSGADGYTLKVFAYRNGLDGLLRSNRLDLLNVEMGSRDGGLDLALALSAPLRLPRPTFDRLRRPQPGGPANVADVGERRDRTPKSDLRGSFRARRVHQDERDRYPTIRQVRDWRGALGPAVSLQVRGRRGQLRAGVGRGGCVARESRRHDLAAGGLPRSPRAAR